MPFLRYQNTVAEHKEYEFRAETSIGSDPDLVALALAADLGVAAEHAVILRSTVTNMPVLVDLQGDSTYVNGLQVAEIKVLHQGDIITLGRARLTFWEVSITRVSPRNRAIGRECPVCTEEFRIGDMVIACPRCNTVHHSDCWFAIPICCFFTCEYPIHEIVMDALAPTVNFERSLDRRSKLVELKDGEDILQPGVHCSAGNPRDQVPFQLQQTVAYCPTCNTPYHLECWLGMSSCVICRYNVSLLIHQVFAAGQDHVPVTR
jgi:Prokaryotic RING finger family 1/FHA domain